MKNTQTVWIMCVIVLSLKFLNVKEGATVAKRQRIINFAGLILYILKKP